MDKSFVFVVFSIVNVQQCNSDYLTKFLLGTKVNNTLDACWWSLLTKLQCAKTTSTDSNFGAPPSLSWWTSFFCTS